MCDCTCTREPKNALVNVVATALFVHLVLHFGIILRESRREGTTVANSQETQTCPEQLGRFQDKRWVGYQNDGLKTSLWCQLLSEQHYIVSDLAEFVLDGRRH